MLSKSWSIKISLGECIFFFYFCDFIFFYCEIQALPAVVQIALFFLFFFIKSKLRKFTPKKHKYFFFLNLNLIFANLIAFFFANLIAFFFFVFAKPYILKIASINCYVTFYFKYFTIY